MPSTALTTDDVVAMVPCYGDGTADTANASILGWTTSATNFIKIYTPTSSSEVGTTQRHSGSWDTTKYYLSVSSAGRVIDNYEAYVWLDGLQTEMNNSDDYHRPINSEGQADVANEFKVSNSIIKMTQSTLADHSEGITLAGAIDTASTAYLWNNIIHGIQGNTWGRAIFVNDNLWTVYAYNNTIVNSTTGIYKSGSTVTAKNNIVQNATDGFTGTFEAGSDYNVSNVVGDDTGGSNDQSGVYVSFVDRGGDDFRLSQYDRKAKNKGTDLSADGDLAFSDDIAGNSRPYESVWDIGAYENQTATTTDTLYRSVGTSTADLNDAVATLTLSNNTATFSVDPANGSDNIGVGMCLST